MSNKKNPTEASHFVRDILRPVSSFFSTLPGSVREELGPAWASEIFGAVCQRYAFFYPFLWAGIYNRSLYSYVSYLAGMKKNEESLRRLRRGQMTGFSLFRTSSPTINNQDAKDDERVRLQMALDVTALGKDARLLGIDIDQHAAYLELKTLASQSTSGMLLPARS